MIKILLVIGLALIPFAMWPGLDSREPKLAMALVFALALSLTGLYQGVLKPVRNKWLLFLMGFFLINIWLCPKPIIPYAGTIIGAFWVWEPFCYALIFFLMYVTLSSLIYNAKEKEILFNIMAWVGLIMSIYVFLQFFGIDQFYSITGKHEAMRTPCGFVGGTLGHPTVVSSFIGMIIPIALFLKKYWFASIMILAVLATKSNVAIGAMIASLVFLYALKDQKTAVLVAITSFIFILLAISAYIYIPQFRPFIGDSGRFGVWQNILKDVNSPIAEGAKQRYPYTGLGIGSFKYIFHVKHSGVIIPFFQAHNEYLEILFTMGIAGLGLFVMSLWTALVGKITRERKFLLTSFACIAIAAGGTFVWHLGAHIYYSIVILALLSTKEITHAR
ncbi:MAG: O-antigen ligase family protein [Gammaproteobacteria bacterium]|nr:O-antigen ligase family protein [Gammaproteobacteria bacterium]